MDPSPSRNRLLPAVALPLWVLMAGCASSPDLGPRVAASDGASQAVCEDERRGSDDSQAELFRQAETDRAANLEREIERLQADLERAEAALVEAESGLAASHSRADAVSSLAVTRIQVERAAARAPWRAELVAAARQKIVEAERQVEEGRFGATLFFVYRARRVADAILREAEQVRESPNAQMIRAERVNLRAGPSTHDLVLSVLTARTPVIEQAREGEWTLVQVIGGPAGWIHRQLLDALVLEDEREGPPPSSVPAARD